MKHRANAVARLICEAWDDGTAIAELPADIRPELEMHGYQAQASLEEAKNSKVVGWKIAATSSAGQTHIGVDGPIAGRIFATNLHNSSAVVSMIGNRMAVAEAEFAFVFARELQPRETPYEEFEVLSAVGSLHPAIELPNSRFENFAAVGAPSLAADNACAHEFVLGPATNVPWQKIDLSAHVVRLAVNETTRVEGTGADVLGDPRKALCWLVNSIPLAERGIRKGEFVTTGVCGHPMSIVSGDDVVADFGTLGKVHVSLSA